MSEYLSKEEIKQWRSSLEKITLEEFAARLGKKIEEAKPSNDIVDIVLKGKPVVSSVEEWMPAKAERISSIAERAFDREREIAPSPFTISNLKLDATEATPAKVEKTPAKKVAKPKATKDKEVEKAIKAVKAVKTTKTTTKKATKTTKTETSAKTTKTKATKAKSASSEALREEVRVVFKKALTDREQKVFDYFVENNNKIVYAKDLATLLELPRDYVYKYIKNLRAKIEGEKLTNADKGGFILNV